MLAGIVHIQSTAENRYRPATCRQRAPVRRRVYPDRAPANDHQTVRRQFPRYWQYFKPSFHPWQTDNYHQVERWKAAYAPK